MREERNNFKQVMMNTLGDIISDAVVRQENNTVVITAQDNGKAKDILDLIRILFHDKLGTFNNTKRDTPQ
jgi:hypothetical protein